MTNLDAFFGQGGEKAQNPPDMRTILLADDDESVRTVYSLVLQKRVTM